MGCQPTGLHFVWKKISAEGVSLTADIPLFRETTETTIAKGVFDYLRQNLDTNSAYVDAARHGGGPDFASSSATRKVERRRARLNRAYRFWEKLRLEKQGDRFYMRA